jgi:hypothetical protein
MQRPCPCSSPPLCLPPRTHPRPRPRPSTCTCTRTQAQATTWTRILTWT